MNYTFPQDMVTRKQWICWRMELSKDGKDSKVPYSPVTGKKASTTNPKDWSAFDLAASAKEQYQYNGLGFVFVKDGGLVGVDIDHCRGKNTGELNDTAMAILERFPSYTEISPSETGLHIFYKGEMPAKGNKNTKTGVEMYAHSRYFTMTGNKLPGTPEYISDDSGALAWIHDSFIKNKKSGNSKKNLKNEKYIPLTDDEILDKASSAENHEDFNNLWDGNWQGSYPSQSEADLALCCKLAFWSGKNKEQMDRLFRKSALYRSKWDKVHHSSGATYGEETLNKAVDATEAVYNPGGAIPIFEHDGHYYRSKAEKVYPITNFVLKPVEMIVAEDETQLTADLVTVRGETYRLTFMSSDFANKQKFKNTLNKRTIALSYTGSDGDLELLKAYISELDWPTKTGVKAMGIYRHNGSVVFVTTDVAVDASGKAVSDIIQLEKYHSIESLIHNAAPLTKDHLQELGEHIMSYNEPAKTVPILAWMAGCFVKTHLREKSVKFPHLMLIGEAGSGKSNTLERIILPVFSRSKILAAGQTTAFTLMKDAASSNTIPMALDEFKPSKTDKYRLDALLNHFRNSYDVQEGIRGRADQSIVSYELLAPLVVAGEEAADEAAIRERSIELLFSKKDLKTGEHRMTFGWLCANTELLSGLGRSLL
ncbi:MAG: DNA primase, partial [Clostridiaceae bacterium]|nr:DNA primase [Clostridiaceae bacterium]